MAIILKQDSPFKAQATERQIQVGKELQNCFRIDEIALSFFSLTLQSMVGNLNGLAKYLPKDSRAKVHNFPTIMLCTGPWHISCQPVDFFFQY